MARRAGGEEAHANPNPIVRVAECARLKYDRSKEERDGEAKNLQARSHGSVGVRDVYCVLSLDQEQIFKSATIEKTLDPFFGEEFQFDIPREFQFLSVYVHDRDRPMKTDKIIGKVSIKREELTHQKGKDQWLAITPVDKDSEVQGKVHVRIHLKSLRHMNDASPQPMVEVKIEECSDLLVINSNCDPYAVVTMHYTDRKQETKKTKTKKKTATPVFDETFFFESSTSRGGGDGSSTYSFNSGGSSPGIGGLYEVGGFHSLQVALFHDPGPMFGHVFLGELRIPMQGLSSSRGMNAWYLLQPRESAVRHHSGSNGVANKGQGLGSLRLNLNYSCTHVFPSQLYDPLRSLLLHTATAQPVSASVGWLLGEVCGSNKQDAAVPLMRVLLQHNQAVPFISNLAAHEMHNISDPNTIFRGNTLASKCMDELMKLAGHHYLKGTLQEAIDQVCREKKPCEVDPTRIPATENRETNLTNLCEYTNTILRAINNSALSCPPVMCQIFSELREHANTFFPNQREVRYSVISGFIFLRFFAPAILGPKLFDITELQIDPSTSRTLTLISKTVQGVGNLVSSRSLNHSFKEEYMRDVFALCTNNKLVDSARTFLEIISSMPNGNLKAYDTPVILREGVMIKRAQGRKKFGLKNFKSRFFRLSTRSLTYAKNKASPPLCLIPVEDILAVESVQESSFKCKNMFQLVQPNRTLYIQAANCVEEKEWLDLLTKVCQYNKHRLKQYHPGAYLNSLWQCCKANSEHAPGCSAVSNYPEVDLNIQIDAEREMECILGLLLNNIDKLKKLHEACKQRESAATLPDEQLEEGTAAAAASTREVIEHMVQAALTLQRHHATHRAALRHTNRPGSKQAPIGDDNYLMLSSTNGHHDPGIWDTGQAVPDLGDFIGPNFSSNIFATDTSYIRSPSGRTNAAICTQPNCGQYSSDLVMNGSRSSSNSTATGAPNKNAFCNAPVTAALTDNRMATAGCHEGVPRPPNDKAAKEKINASHCSNANAGVKSSSAETKRDNCVTAETCDSSRNQSSSNLTIANIRDSIKRNANNNKKRLINTQVNNTLKSASHLASSPPQTICEDVPELPSTRKRHDDSSCPGLPCVDNKCVGTSASDLRVRNGPQDLFSCGSNVAHVNAGNKVNCPETRQHGETVQCCLGTIANAVKSSAEFLNKVDRQIPLVPSNENDFLLSSVSLPNRLPEPRERTLYSPPSSRPFSDTVNYCVSSPIRPGPSLLRHSAHPVLESTHSSLDYANIESNTNCSDQSSEAGGSVQGAANDCVMASLEEEEDEIATSSSGSYASVASEEPDEPMDVGVSGVPLVSQAGTVGSSETVVMYATGVDQCFKTVYQEVATPLTAANSNCPSSSTKLKNSQSSRNVPIAKSSLLGSQQQKTNLEEECQVKMSMSTSVAAASSCLSRASTAEQLLSENSYCPGVSSTADASEVWNDGVDASVCRHGSRAGRAGADPSRESGSETLREATLDIRLIESSPGYLV